MTTGVFNDGVAASLRAQEQRERGELLAADASDRQAIAAFDQVLADDPRHVGALSGKALSLAVLGKTQEAAILFQQAIDVDPDFAESHRQLGLCHLELGDVPAARTATFTALALEPRTEYRRIAAVEIYNIGGRIMANAAKCRESGRNEAATQGYVQAKATFSLAMEIDRDLAAAADALHTANACLGLPDEEHPSATDTADAATPEPRGFWRRLFG